VFRLVFFGKINPNVGISVVNKDGRPYIFFADSNGYPCLIMWNNVNYIFYQLSNTFRVLEGTNFSGTAEHQYWVDTNQNIYQSYFNNSWIILSINTDQVKARKNSYISGGENSVFFFDETGKITQYLVKYNNVLQPNIVNVAMPTEAKCTTESRSLAVPIGDPDQQCYFRDDNNHLCRINLDNGWKYNPIQTASGNKTEHANVPLVVSNSGCASQTDMTSLIEQSYYDYTYNVWKYISLSEVAQAPNDSVILESIDLQEQINFQEIVDQTLSTVVQNNNPNVSISQSVSFTVTITTTLTNTWSETNTITSSTKEKAGIDKIFSAEENLTVTNTYTFGSSTANTTTTTVILQTNVSGSVGASVSVTCLVYKSTKDVPYIATFKNINTNKEFKIPGTFHAANGCSKYRFDVK